MRGTCHFYIVFTLYIMQTIVQIRNCESMSKDERVVEALIIDFTISVNLTTPCGHFGR